jgi:DNA segregation ATPase FtsK/SpoIIIE, S-DNA-T family
MNEGPFFSSNDLIDCIVAKDGNNQVANPDNQYFQTIIDSIETKLNEFKLSAKIINILKGPVVDTFELELGEGIKVSKVTNLTEDIGLALNGVPIRMVYPMRGKSTIGIEVPRNPREIIFLDEVLRKDAFAKSNKILPVAMGKNAFGETTVVDLAEMPHMLVAGATGAGKSVFINTMLVSLIIKKSPQEMKLILIDPKQLELAVYSTLPHLMLPVITEPKFASISLIWACQEMERRYTVLKELGVKNIDGFNRKIKNADRTILSRINQYYKDSDTSYELPYIVIIIDEFADLILSKHGKEIELNVNRLAAKARAAGIHLVVATQRPSTDVVTGVVKANFPTRVAFRVTVGHDSKTILDQYGAEKLLGKGDMLYKHGVDLMRLHSSYVDEEEIETLVSKLTNIPQEFNEDALDFLEAGAMEGDDSVSITIGDGFAGGGGSGTGVDDLYDEAVKVVMESRAASASMIQRRLRVGYNRAANLIEEMERKGVVGPAQGAKPRKVLIASDQ